MHHYVQAGTKALDKAVAMADAVDKVPADPPLSVRSHEVLNAVGARIENASRSGASMHVIYSQGGSYYI